MENIVNFVAEHYAWFLTINIILLFALIGYIYDTKKNKNKEESLKEFEDFSLENIEVKNDKSLNEMVNHSKNINPETKAVEIEEVNTEVQNNQNMN